MKYEFTKIEVNLFQNGLISFRTPLKQQKQACVNKFHDYIMLISLTYIITQLGYLNCKSVQISQTKNIILQYRLDRSKQDNTIFVNMTSFGR